MGGTGPAAPGFNFGSPAPTSSSSSALSSFGSTQGFGSQFSFGTSGKPSDPPASASFSFSPSAKPDDIEKSPAVPAPTAFGFPKPQDKPQGADDKKLAPGTSPFSFGATPAITAAPSASSTSSIFSLSNPAKPQPPFDVGKTGKPAITPATTSTPGKAVIDFGSSSTGGAFGSTPGPTSFSSGGAFGSTPGTGSFSSSGAFKPSPTFPAAPSSQSTAGFGYTIAGTGGIGPSAGQFGSYAAPISAPPKLSSPAKASSPPKKSPVTTGRGLGSISLDLGSPSSGSGASRLDNVEDDSDYTGKPLDDIVKNWQAKLNRHVVTVLEQARRVDDRDKILMDCEDEVWSTLLR